MIIFEILLVIVVSLPFVLCFVAAELMRHNRKH